LPRPFWVAGAGEDGPRLGNGIDLALAVLGRAKGRTIVIVGAAIPLAIPAVFFNGLADRLGLGAVALGVGGLTHTFAKRGKGRQRAVEEPAQPDAFPFTFNAHAIHAVVPVAGPHKRNPMPTGGDRAA